MFSYIRRLLLEQKKNDRIYSDPGVYKFQIQFSKFSHDSIAYSEIEMHIGREDDLEEGYMATVIMRSTDGYGITNFVEYIATNVRRTLSHKIKPDQIRWVEIEPPTSGNHHRPACVVMNWDRKKQEYSSPKWKRVSPEAWYYEKEPYVES